MATSSSAATSAGKQRVEASWRHARILLVRLRLGRRAKAPPHGTRGAHHVRARQLETHSEEQDLQGGYVVEEPCPEKKRINGLSLRLHEEAHVEVL